MKPINIFHLRQQAKKRLPAPIFHYIDGGSDDEWSLQNNTKAFDKYELLPQHLKNIENIDLTTSLFGKKMDLPFFLSPTGMSRLFHHEKEMAVARAADEAGIFYTLSTLATTSLEEIEEISNGPKIFQIYIFKDRGLVSEFVQRCKASKYDALCLTIDTPIAGNRERDILNGMTMPPRFSMKSLWSFATNPCWSVNLLKNPNFNLENVAHRVDALANSSMGLIEYVNSQFDRTVTWKEAEWLSKEWSGKFIIKGLQSPEDAKRAKDIGANAIMISNHGGRQLEGSPAPVDCIRPIREVIGNDLELVVDGGIRRGTHIIKAIALGANACSIGRPYLYGLASGGQKGVRKAIDILKTELERSMALLGCTSIKDLNEKQIASF